MFNQIPQPQLTEPIMVAAMRKLLIEELQGQTETIEEIKLFAINELEKKSPIGQELLAIYMRSKSNMLQSICDTYENQGTPKPLLDWCDYLEGSIVRARKTVEEAQANLLYLRAVDPNKLPVTVRITSPIDIEWDDCDKPLLVTQKEGSFQDAVNLALNTFKTEHQDVYLDDYQVQVSCKFPSFIMNAKWEHVSEMIEIWKSTKR